MPVRTYVLAYAIGDAAIVGAEESGGLVVFTRGNARKFLPSQVKSAVLQSEVLTELVVHELCPDLRGLALRRLRDLPKAIRVALCKEHLPAWVYG